MGKTKLIGMDGGLYDNFADRNAANTKYLQNKKQIEELEKANRLNERKIYEDNKQEQEAKKKTNNKKRLENLEKEKLEKSRQEHDKEMRYLELCDKLNLNYFDLKKLDTWINSLTLEQEEKYKKYILENEDQSLNNEILELKNQLEEKKKIYKDSKISIAEYKYENKTEYEIQTILLSEKESQNTAVGLIICAIIGTIFFFAISLKVIGFIGLLLTVLFVIYDYATAYKIKKINESLTIYNKKQDEISHSIDEIKLKIRKYKEQKIEIEESDNKKDSLLAEARNALNGIYFPNKIKFNEFRLNHYNKDIEMLFRKLEINLDKCLDDEIISNGTIEDYQDFIDKNVI